MSHILALLAEMVMLCVPCKVGNSTTLPPGSNVTLSRLQWLAGAKVLAIGNLSNVSDQGIRSDEEMTSFWETYTSTWLVKAATCGEASSPRNSLLRCQPASEAGFDRNFKAVIARAGSSRHGVTGGPQWYLRKHTPLHPRDIDAEATGHFVSRRLTMMWTYQRKHSIS